MLRLPGRSFSASAAPTQMQEKFHADLAASRFGLAPRKLDRFVYDIFLYRYGVRGVAMDKIMQFAR